MSANSGNMALIRLANQIMGEFITFAEMERRGWSDAAKSSGYVELFAAASDQAISALLDASGATPGLKVLDLCCGHGNVSQALVERGCDVVGVDFSPTMLSYARANLPQVCFVEADAQDLPHESSEFDVVVSNLGICHVPDQPRALCEIKRVLRPGGRLAMTVWCGPEASPAFEIVYRAILTAGDPAVTAPSGPDFHQFSRKSSADQLLLGAGFSNVDLQIVDCALDLEDPDQLFEVFQKGTVRAATILAAQPRQRLELIRQSMRESVLDRCRERNHWRVSIPAALVSATA